VLSWSVSDEVNEMLNWSVSDEENESAQSEFENFQL